MNTLSEKLRAIRTAKGYSQQYMAEQLAVSRSTYIRLETKPELLNISQLLHLSQVFGISPSYLLPDADAGEALYARMIRLESKLEEMMLKMVLVQAENHPRYS
ncbi:helix-turn-helix domain-containing protein [Siphonobacter aquaeclarae]|uniref:Helix-turn-helix domain-containing protein n=1 Tax=Siphonobacter aquaeclarae TaxID=563176 RepID=A0A1G9IXX3_9BACT|nr:helix-turn-helix transcriptional regulator [Siphonobacter aquaeclarae]SDL29931.1 Helix-turn-helix domain-containing protein [Siphonobacter aquaeclarae]